MNAEERKRKSAKERKRAQKSAKALPRKKCKQPGLKQPGPGLGTPKRGLISNFHLVVLAVSVVLVVSSVKHEQPSS